jgi:hypothetical protein
MRGCFICVLYFIADNGVHSSENVTHSFEYSVDYFKNENIQMDCLYGAQYNNINPSNDRQTRKAGVMSHSMNYSHAQ